MVLRFSTTTVQATQYRQFKSALYTPDQHLRRYIVSVNRRDATQNHRKKKKPV